MFGCHLPFALEVCEVYVAGHDSAMTNRKIMTVGKCVPDIIFAKIDKDCLCV